jgi:hypothetical protein
VKLYIKFRGVHTVVLVINTGGDCSVQTQLINKVGGGGGVAIPFGKGWDNHVLVQWKAQQNECGSYVLNNKNHISDT